MSDLRKQLRKAGLVSKKQLRQAKHQERVHASTVGREGLAAEREEKDKRLRADEEARRRSQKQHQEERKRAEAEKSAASRLERVIQSGWIPEATAGSRRFFIETGSGRISYLDISDIAARKLAEGSAAIIETAGVVRGEFCVVAARAAEEIGQIRPDLILFWNRGGQARV